MDKEKRKPNRSLARIEPSALHPTINWAEAMENTSSSDVTKLALEAAKGTARFPGARLPGLSIETAKEASAIKRYGMFAIETASLFYEHKDGQMDDESAHRRAKELIDFYDQAQSGRRPYDTFFKDEAKRTGTVIPPELDEVLKNPTKLQDKYPA